MVADDDFINKVGYVLTFLHQAGLNDVQQALLTALEERFPGTSGAQPSASVEEQPTTSSSLPPLHRYIHIQFQYAFLVCALLAFTHANWNMNHIASMPLAFAVLLSWV